MKCPPKAINLGTYFIQQFYFTSSSNITIPVRSYSNADTQKLEILQENKGKSGIYRWANILNGKTYVGSAKDLSKRLGNYYSFSYLTSIDYSLINKAILKYGYSNFSFEILEYCNQSVLLKREQFYLDTVTS